MRLRNVIAAITLGTMMVYFNAGTYATANNNPEAVERIIENELLTKCTVYKAKQKESEDKSQAIENLNKYIKEVNEKTEEIAKLDPLKVSKEILDNFPSFPSDFVMTEDLELIAEGKKAENKAKEQKKKIQDEQEKERKRKEEEARRKREEQRRQEEQRQAEIRRQNEKANGGSGMSSGSQQAVQTSSGQKSSKTTQQASSSRPVQQSHKSRREQWMWQLINSYPEPARRGLKGAKVVETLGGNYAGMTYPSSMTIEIANWIKDNTFRGTVAHEIGHIYHLRTGLDQTQEWIEIYNAEWAGRGYYGSHNEKEAFAETFKAIYAPGSYGARSAGSIPRSVNFMKQKLNSGI